MSTKKNHSRQYDIVVFGATGYTGKYTAEYIAERLPTDLKWAIAGRSQTKLEEVLAHCKTTNPDRGTSYPSIEVCDLNDSDLSALAKKTFILIACVGPFCKLGEYAFKACAENGTHYLDVTGETPWVLRMINTYSSAAQKSGALLFPQFGIESAPPDLLTYSLASHLRTEHQAKTEDVIISIHTFNCGPSGGTLATVFSIADYVPLPDFVAAYKPYALSPKPNPARVPPPSLWTKLTGLITAPELGLLTTSVAHKTDAALVHRSWGLLEGTDRAYGPKFSFREFMKTRNYLTGFGMHLGIVLLQIAIVTPFIRRFLAGWVRQPGTGPDEETARRDEIEYRGVAKGDVEDGKEKPEVVGKAWFRGRGAYYCDDDIVTGMLVAEGADTLLRDDAASKLEGGVYTPAVLGQPLLDRLEKGGLHFETKTLEK
ncbi:Saccharopine dehydrogenase-domain-containing protein [Podospora fimiseda]|uniref:Saccharopine dehydrogenase-domain-containing protein n=1 Tax=Podospora fimiseda TaxID=252190 RepID=A0AAN7BWR1_9PEZI|nr:Saccharopine dehydrogenase-domain-containing protein [Podospora fimiseda]